MNPFESVEHSSSLPIHVTKFPLSSILARNIPSPKNSALPPSPKLFGPFTPQISSATTTVSISQVAVTVAASSAHCLSSPREHCHVPLIERQACSIQLKHPSESKHSHVPNAELQRWNWSSLQSPKFSKCTPPNSENFGNSHNSTGLLHKCRVYSQPDQGKVLKSPPPDLWGQAPTPHIQPPTTQISPKHHSSSPNSNPFLLPSTPPLSSPRTLCSQINLLSPKSEHLSPLIPTTAQLEREIPDVATLLPLPPLHLPSHHKRRAKYLSEVHNHESEEAICSTRKNNTQISNPFDNKSDFSTVPFSPPTASINNNSSAMPASSPKTPAQDEINLQPSSGMEDDDQTRFQDQTSIECGTEPIPLAAIRVRKHRLSEDYPPGKNKPIIGEPQAKRKLSSIMARSISAAVSPMALLTLSDDLVRIEQPPDPSAERMENVADMAISKTTEDNGRHPKQPQNLHGVELLKFEIQQQKDQTTNSKQSLPLSYSLEKKGTTAITTTTANSSTSHYLTTSTVVVGNDEHNQQNGHNQGALTSSPMTERHSSPDPGLRGTLKSTSQVYAAASLLASPQVSVTLSSAPVPTSPPQLDHSSTLQTQHNHDCKVISGSSNINSLQDYQSHSVGGVVTASAPSTATDSNLSVSTSTDQIKTLASGLQNVTVVSSLPLPLSPVHQTLDTTENHVVENNIETQKVSESNTVFDHSPGKVVPFAVALLNQTTSELNNSSSSRASSTSGTGSAPSGTGSSGSTASTNTSSSGAGGGGSAGSNTSSSTSTNASKEKDKERREGDKESKPTKVRQRTAIACNYCRRRKIRCSGLVPSDTNRKCTNCIRFNQECIFAPVMGVSASLTTIPIVHQQDPGYYQHHLGHPQQQQVPQGYPVIQGQMPPPIQGYPPPGHHPGYPPQHYQQQYGQPMYPPGYPQQTIPAGLGAPPPQQYYVNQPPPPQQQPAQQYSYPPVPSGHQQPSQTRPPAGVLAPPPIPPHPSATTRYTSPPAQQQGPMTPYGTTPMQRAGTHTGPSYGTSAPISPPPLPPPYYSPRPVSQQQQQQPQVPAHVPPPPHAGQQQWPYSSSSSSTPPAGGIPGQQKLPHLSAGGYSPAQKSPTALSRAQSYPYPMPPGSAQYPPPALPYNTRPSSVTAPEQSGNPSLHSHGDPARRPSIALPPPSLTSGVSSSTTPVYSPQGYQQGQYSGYRYQQSSQPSPRVPHLISRRSATPEPLRSHSRTSSAAVTPVGERISASGSYDDHKGITSATPYGSPPTGYQSSLSTQHGYPQLLQPVPETPSSVSSRASTISMAAHAPLATQYPQSPLLPQPEALRYSGNQQPSRVEAPLVSSSAPPLSFAPSRPHTPLIGSAGILHQAGSDLSPGRRTAPGSSVIGSASLVRANTISGLSLHSLRPAPEQLSERRRQRNESEGTSGSPKKEGNEASPNSGRPSRKRKSGKVSISDLLD